MPDKSWVDFIFFKNCIVVPAISIAVNYTFISKFFTKKSGRQSISLVAMSGVFHLLSNQGFTSGKVLTPEYTGCSFDCIQIKPVSKRYLAMHRKTAILTGYFCGLVFKVAAPADHSVPLNTDDKKIVALPGIIYHHFHAGNGIKKLYSLSF